MTAEHRRRNRAVQAAHPAAWRAFLADADAITADLIDRRDVAAERGW